MKDAEREARERLLLAVASWNDGEDNHIIDGNEYLSNDGELLDPDTFAERPHPMDDIVSLIRARDEALRLLGDARGDLGCWNGHAGDCSARHDKQYRCKCGHPELIGRIDALLGKEKTGG